MRSLWSSGNQNEFNSSITLILKFDSTITFSASICLVRQHWWGSIGVAALGDRTCVAALGDRTCGAALEGQLRSGCQKSPEGAKSKADERFPFDDEEATTVLSRTEK